MNRERCFVNGLKPKKVSFLIRRHIFVAISVDLVLKQPLIDVVHDGDSAFWSTVILRQNAITYSGHHFELFSCKKTNRRDLESAVFYNIAGRCVPKRLLVKRAVSRIVSGLALGCDTFTGFRIHKPPASIVIVHLLSSISTTRPQAFRTRQTVMVRRSEGRREACALSWP